MSIVWDPTVAMNLVLALVIVCLGALVYKKTKTKELGLYIGIGFVFFAVSHTLTLLGYGSFSVVLIPIRALGYLMVILALYIHLKKRY